MDKIKLPDRYRIIESIGQGVSGKVYKVFDSNMSKELALKTLLNYETGMLESFRDEFHLLSTLSHPNLVRVHDFGIALNGIPYFSMDLVVGLDLKSYLKTGVNKSNIINILSSVFSALEYLHKSNIIHGDIKPENIIVSSANSKDPRIILLDFGLSKLRSTDSNKVSGTLKYLAPEAISFREYSIQSDLFALGISLIECLVDLDIPTPGNLDEDFIRTAYNELSTVLSDSNVLNPSSLASLIVSLINPDPKMRPSNAKDCSFSLENSGTKSVRRPSIDYSNFYNRKKELEFINKFLDSSEPSLALLLRGHTGVGKKALLNRTVTTAQLNDFITIHCDERLTNDTPLEYFIELVCNHLSQNNASDFRNSQQMLVSYLTQRNDTNSRDGNLKTNILFDNIVQRIHELSKSNPVLICIPEFLSYGYNFVLFVKHLLYESGILKSNVKVILTQSSDKPIDETITKHIEEMENSEYLIKYETKPFDQESLNNYLNDLFTDGLFSKREIDEVYRASSGIILYVHKLLQHLLNLEVLSFKSNAWYLDHNRFSSTSIPDTFEDIVKITLNEFSLNEIKIIRTLAVLNSALTTQDIHKLFPNSTTDELDQILTKLIKQNILTQSDDFLFFTNPSYSLQIIKSIPEKENSDINLAIANHMMQSNPNDFAKIYKYLLNGGDTKRCIEYGIKAADQFISRYNHHDAYIVLSHLLSISDTLQSTVLKSILSRIVNSETIIGLINEAEAHYEKLIELSSDIENKSNYLFQMGRLQEKYLSNKVRAVNYYEQALTHARNIEDKDLISEILISIGYTMTPDDPISVIQEAVNLSKDRNIDLYTLALSRIIYLQKINGHIDEMNQNISILKQTLNGNEVAPVILRIAYYTLYLVAFFNADYSESKIYLNNMVELSNKYHDEIENVFNLTMLGGQHYIQGDYPQMISALERGFSLAERFGMLSSQILLSLNLSNGYNDITMYGKAIDSINYAKSIADEKNVHNLVLTFYLRPLSLYIRLGKHFDREIKGYSKKLEEGAQRNKDSIMLGHNRLWQSRYYYQDLSLEKALQRAEAALKHFKEADDKDDVVDSLIQIAMCAMETGDYDRASNALKEARDIFDAIKCNYLSPSLLLAEGSLSRINGNDSAESDLSEAIKISTKMGTRENTWQAYRQLALLYESRGDSHLAISAFRDATETIKQITESIPGEPIKLSYLSLPFRKRVFEEIKSLGKSSI